MIERLTAAQATGVPADESLRRELDALLDYQSGCWARGERPAVESCLGRLPGGGATAEAALDLICHEILLRARLGESPGVEEYVRRFPQFADQLRAHFEVHQAMGLSPASTAVPRPAAAGAAPPAIAGYDILGEVGRGAMGVVYKARRRGLNRLTALKLLRPAAAGPREAERFRAEAEALARVEHPNIVRVYEVGEHEGRPFVALEFVEGGGLDATLRGAPQPPRRAASLAETLARAVHEAHRRGVVHRDLKPANVLLTADGAPKVTDFGLAKRIDGQAGQTRHGEILGTPSYMAPEQARGDNASVGPRTDVYALGAILYELLTGRPPFCGETVWDTLEQVVRREPAPPRQLAPRAPRDLETICLKCLRKEPARRYGSGAEMADDLRRFLNGEPVRARPASAVERAWKWARRRPAAVAAMAAVVVATAALAGAHYADLRARLAEAERAAAAADVRGRLEALRGRLNAGRWQEAASRLRDETAPRLRRARDAFPADAELATLAAEADRLGGRIDRRLSDDARLARFRALRKQVQFLATPFSGLDETTRRVRVRDAAAEALNLFEMSAASDDAPDADGFPEAEQEEIREGCCELLLETARVEPADADAARAGLLNRAARLGVDTPLIASARRAPSRQPLSTEAGARGEKGPAPLTRAFEWFLDGDDLCREGRWADAAAAFEKALSLRPDHAAAHYALAVCCLKAAAADDAGKAQVLLAQEHLSACIEEEPDLVWPRLQRALARGQLHDDAGAEADFDAAERLLRDAPDATAKYALLISRGVARIRRNDAAGAVADLEQAVDMAPDEPAAYVDLAMAYQKHRRLDEAVAQLDRALKRTPAAGSAALYRDRARLDKDRDDPEAAVRDLDEAVRRDPGGAADDRLAQARLFHKVGRWDDAVRAADASLAAKADRPEAHRLRADALLHLGRGAEAVDALGRCLDAEREAGRAPDADLYLARAQASAAAGDAAGAAEDYTHYLASRPLDAAALAARGRAYAALDAPRLAVRDFEASIRLDPENAEAYNGRGYALARTGRPQEAVKDAEEALRRGPPRPGVFYDAARIFGRVGEAAEMDPRERLQMQARALDLLRRALEALPEPERVAFWRRTVRRDAALNSLRADEAFQRLDAAYAGPD
jgi:tetratricopeptide (TPR) repeat protein